jgi:hypothetical protein
MKEFIRQEKEEERQCLWVKLKNQPCPTNLWIRGITQESEKLARTEVVGTGQCEEKTPTLNHSPTSKGKGKRVSFKFTQEQFYRMSGAARNRGIPPPHPGVCGEGKANWPMDPPPPLLNQTPRLRPHHPQRWLSLPLRTAPAYVPSSGTPSQQRPQAGHHRLNPLRPPQSLKS